MGQPEYSSMEEALKVMKKRARGCQFNVKEWVEAFCCKKKKKKNYRLPMC